MEHDLFRRLAEQGAMIERLASDSRRCAPGTAFFAYPGESSDGRRFVADAVARGASAVVWEAEGWSWPADLRTPNAGVKNLRARAGVLADAFHGRPSESLWVCGVTGTNGKTSCSQWIAALLGLGGRKSAVIGTLGNGFPGALAASANTTPDALELHRLLREFRDAKAAAVAMEVSSHALVQGRVNGVRFDCALFTNLSHDHLDYHGSMEAYAEAKARLFDMPGLGTAVLNLDDVAGVRIARRLAGRGVRTIGYSLSPAAIAPGSVDESIAAASLGAGAVEVRSSFGEGRARLPVFGRFNVANALGVLGCLAAAGIEFREALALLEQLPAVPGRMERIGDSVAHAPLVVVDYAHTPDALEKALAALRPEAEARGGRLVVVFGAGGERDPAKRPLMGAIAERLADRVVLTSDNPRSEDPEAILGAIRAGMAGAPEEQPDRALAIEQAILGAAAGDVVLIAGKGHEAWQEIGARRLPFSDAQAARSALRRRS